MHHVKEALRRGWSVSFSPASGKVLLIVIRLCPGGKPQRWDKVVNTPRVAVIELGRLLKLHDDDYQQRPRLKIHA
jgi:hypothetical protein